MFGIEILDNEEITDHFDHDKPYNYRVNCCWQAQNQNPEQTLPSSHTPLQIITMQELADHVNNDKPHNWYVAILN